MNVFLNEEGKAKLRDAPAARQTLNLNKFIFCLSKRLFTRKLFQ